MNPIFYLHNGSNLSGWDVVFALFLVVLWIGLTKAIDYLFFNANPPQYYDQTFRNNLKLRTPYQITKDMLECNRPECEDRNKRWHLHMN